MLQILSSIHMTQPLSLHRIAFLRVQFPFWLLVAAVAAALTWAVAVVVAALSQRAA
jgi:hypothetical protein